jgi:tetratricopeptide (TPR) repeat protein
MHRICFLLIFFLIARNVRAQQNEIDVQPIIDWVDANIDPFPKKVLDTLQSSIEKAKKRNDNRALEMLYDKSSRVYYNHFADFNQSIRQMQALEDLYHRTKRFETKLIYLENMAVLYYESKSDVPRALKMFTEARELAAKKNTKLKSGSLNNFGVAYMVEGKIHQALLMFEEARQLEEIYVEKKKLYPVILKNIGVCHYLDHRHDSAQFYLEKSYFEAKKTKAVTDNPQTAGFLGIFFQETGQTQRALTLLKEAERGITNVKSYSRKADIYNGLYCTYLDLKDYKTACYYLEKYNLYKDSVQISKISKQLVSTEYNLKIKELEEQYTFEKKTTENQRFNQNLFFLIAILSLMVILAFVWIIYNRSKTINQSNELKMTKMQLEKVAVETELSLNEREVTSKSLFLMEKDNLIQRVVKLLSSAKDEISDDAKPVIQEIINELSFSMNNKQWEEFELRFNKVNPNFYLNLKTKHPTLTPNEEKLCAFLQMKMSTKDIGLISGQTSHSINVARTRLRKKMDLANTEVNITNYLNEFI